MREERNVHKVWWEIPKERDHSQDRDVEGRMGSECILGKLAGECELDLVGSGYGPVEVSAEYGDDSFRSGAMELVSSSVKLLNYEWIDCK
jgi:hypothetical protein